MVQFVFIINIGDEDSSDLDDIQFDRPGDISNGQMSSSSMGDANSSGNMANSSVDDPNRSSNLLKIAEAANKKMRKLKTNFSLKKSDITRSLSRIRRTGIG